MKNRKITHTAKNPQFEEALQTLIDYAESVKMKGTSATNGVGLIEINDSMWEIQLRIEQEQESFIGGIDVLESIGKTVRK